MVSAAYVPDRGDIVWLNFSPQAGHEQAGRRPALVLSLKSYNDTTGPSPALHGYYGSERLPL